jgi:hypothetical protein
VHLRDPALSPARVFLAVVFSSLIYRSDKLPNFFLDFLIAPHRNYRSESYLRAGGVMPIYPLLRQSTFEPEHARAMGAAFECALSDLGLTDRNDPLVQMVAKKIIELGQRGLRDPIQLREQAIREIKT